MAAFQELFGDTLMRSSGERVPISALEGKHVGLYFSAHWCGPCRGFTPRLAASYKQLQSDGKPFEVVFVSSDENESEFKEYFGEMPWLALPFEDRARKMQLSKSFKVRGIPTLVILDDQGKTVTTKGRESVADDPAGAKFPWVPPTFHQALGDKFIKNDGTEVDRSALEGKYIGLYFSAHWCPPCRAFTPRLMATYEKLKAAGKPLEIIFCSSDNNESEFNEYFAEMPWLAIPLSDRSRKTALSNLFEVEGIPTLVIVDSEGKTVNADGRAAVAADPEGANFPWRPEPVLDLSVGASGINEAPSVVVMMEGVAADEQSKVIDALRAVSTPMLEAAFERDTEPELRFFFASAENGMTSQIRRLTSTSADRKPKMMLIDIPDNGGYYVSDATDITVDAVRAFVDAYKRGELTRKQMS